MRYRSLDCSYVVFKWLKMCFTAPSSCSILNKKKTGRVKVNPKATKSRSNIKVVIGGLLIISFLGLSTREELVQKKTGRVKVIPKAVKSRSNIKVVIGG